MKRKRKNIETLFTYLNISHTFPKLTFSYYVNAFFCIHLKVELNVLFVFFHNH